MQNSEIEKLINRLNSGESIDQLYQRPLSENVVWVKYWPGIVSPMNNVCYPDGALDFYFVRNSENLFIGAVLDMYSDLHWFMLPNFRRKGHLTRALSQTIMPHLFFIRVRESQRITIDANVLNAQEFQSSRKVALATGFKMKSEKDGISVFQAHKEDCLYQIFIEGTNTGISEERKDIITKKINYLSRSLWLIQDEIEMCIGDNEYSEEINELRMEIKKHVIRFEDKWYENKSSFI